LFSYRYTTSIEFASAISLTIAKPKPIEFTFEDFFSKRSKMLTSFKASNEPVLLISNAWSFIEIVICPFLTLCLMAF
jgi:hypothetical protein